MGAYAQSVLRDAEPLGQLLPVGDLRALLVPVILQDQLPVVPREPLHAAFEALVLLLHLVRIRGGRGQGGGRVLSQGFQKDFLRHRVKIEGGVANVILSNGV